MHLKSVGLVIADNKITLKLTLTGNLKAKQMDLLIEKFRPIFSRLRIDAKILFPENSFPLYVLKRKISQTSGFEYIPEDYIGYIKNQYDEIKEIIDTLDNLESEIERFSKIQEVVNG